MKNKSFSEKTCCAKEPDPVHGIGDPSGFSNRGSGAWSAGPNLEGIHHGEEAEEKEGFLIFRHRRPLQIRGARSMRSQTELRLDVCQEGAGLVPALLL
jgi:hypothetical protein